MSTDAVTPAVDTALLAAAATAELEDWGPLEEATGEPMQTSGVTLWSSADGSQDTGVWQCTAGPSYWVQEENEFVHILSGSLTVTPDGGSPRSWALATPRCSRAAGAAPGTCTRPSARSTSSSEL